MGKKYISILLAVALALTICATGVQAAEARQSIPLSLTA